MTRSNLNAHKMDSYVATENTEADLCVFTRNEIQKHFVKRKKCEVSVPRVLIYVKKKKKKSNAGGKSCLWAEYLEAGYGRWEGD